MGFAANLEAFTSREYKICGAIGPCSSLKKGGMSVAETEMGEVFLFLFCKRSKEMIIIFFLF